MHLESGRVGSRPCGQRPRRRSRPSSDGARHLLVGCTGNSASRADRSLRRSQVIAVTGRLSTNFLRSKGQCEHIVVDSTTRKANNSTSSGPRTRSSSSGTETSSSGGVGGGGRQSHDLRRHGAVQDERSQCDPDPAAPDDFAADICLAPIRTWFSPPRLRPPTSSPWRAWPGLTVVTSMTSSDSGGTATSTSGRAPSQTPTERPLQRRRAVRKLGLT